MFKFLNKISYESHYNCRKGYSAIFKDISWNQRYIKKLKWGIFRILVSFEKDFSGKFIFASWKKTVYFNLCEVYKILQRYIYIL